MKYHILRIAGGVEPELSGPYRTIHHRDKVARKQAKTKADSIFWMNVSVRGVIKVGSYSDKLPKYSDECWQKSGGWAPADERWIPSFVRRQRKKGHSWSWISKCIFDEADINISPATLRRRCIAQCVQCYHGCRWRLS